MKQLSYTLTILLSMYYTMLVCTRQPDKLNILLTNDDGYHTEEIQTLKQTLKDQGHTVFLVAPSSNQSGCGTSVQLSSKQVTLLPIDINEYALASTEIGYTSGPHAGQPWPATPGQCVLVGEELMHQTGYIPDLVISGPNRGENVSIRCLHSGTVGAAQVARSVCMGRNSIPSIAVSINLGANESRIQETADFIAHLVHILDTHRDETHALLPEGILLNINVPGLHPHLNEQAPIKGVALCCSGHAVYDIYHKGNTVFRAYDKGDDIFSIDLCVVDNKDTVIDSDNLKLYEGYITIVPFMTDFTAHDNLQKTTNKLKIITLRN